MENFENGSCLKDFEREGDSIVDVLTKCDGAKQTEKDDGPARGHGEIVEEEITGGDKG